MKKLLSLCIGMLSIGLHAADTVFVKTPQVPILIERHDNVLAYLRLDAKETKTLDNVTISFDKNVPLSQIKAIKLYYGGTEAPQDRGKKRFAPVEYISSNTFSLKVCTSYVVPVTLPFPALTYLNTV